VHQAIIFNTSLTTVLNVDVTNIVSALTKHLVYELDDFTPLNNTDIESLHHYNDDTAPDGTVTRVTEPMLILRDGQYSLANSIIDHPPELAVKQAFFGR
jgi:hypothetical protein